MNEKNIVNAKMKESEGKKLIFILGPGVVTTDKLHDSAVTPEKVNPNTFELIQGMIDKRGDDLQNQIDGIDEHGIAVSNEFGGDSHISVSQKTMTYAINKLWEKIEEITGEMLHGINMLVSPEYYIGEEGCTVTISAVATADIEGVFERIAFYKKQQGQEWELIKEEFKVDNLDAQTIITDTTEIKCEAKIMGIDYTRLATITHYSSFLLGAGNSYTDLMIDADHFNPQYVIPITNDMRGAYDVSVTQGERFIIIVGEALSGFIRADMNGFEIPFTESTVTVSGNNYKVFTSENAYNAGIYNIDING